MNILRKFIKLPPGLNIKANKSTSNSNAKIKSLATSIKSFSLLPRRSMWSRKNSLSSLKPTVCCLLFQRHESNLYSNSACCFYDHHDHTYHHFLTQTISSKLSLMSKMNKKIEKKNTKLSKNHSQSVGLHVWVNSFFLILIAIYLFC